MTHLRSLVIETLPDEVEEEELREHFGSVGRVENVLLGSPEHGSGRSFIVFTASASVAKACTSLGSVKWQSSSGPVTLVCTPAVEADEFDIAKLTELAKDPLDEFIETLSEPHLARLREKLDQRLSGKASPPVVGIPRDRPSVSYPLVQRPRLPPFSGDPQTKDTPYSQWRYQVQCLIDNPNYSGSEIEDAIRFSLKGTAAEILLCLDSGADAPQILYQFDLRFGEVVDINLVREQYYGAQQEPGESIVQWGCRLQKLLHTLKQRGQISSSEADSSLKSRFWYGLHESYQPVKDALRVPLKAGDSFDKLFCCARELELEYAGSPHPLRSPSSSAVTNPSRKTYAQQQTFSDLAQAVNTVLKKLEGVETRLSKLEHAQTKTKQPKQLSRPAAGFNPSTFVPDNNEPRSEPKRMFCTRCRRTNHFIRDCVAGRDIDGRPLNLRLPTPTGGVM